MTGVIGVVPPFAKLLDEFKLSRGSTFSLKGESVRLDNKLLEQQISVTPGALPYLRAAMATDYAWLAARGICADGPTSITKTEYQLVKGSRGLTVPKNAKTDRFIAAEPTGNMFLQLGIGSFLKRRLKRVGVHLDNQQWNQVFAEWALDLGLATVDLKGASDSICRELVWQLFPIRWAQMLDDLRSHQMLVNDKWTVLEKFSSMGNGFTFEIESLIFWALTTTLCEEMGESTECVSVYGDDIICPVRVVPELIELFAYVGFTTNVKKTHYADMFRESCGKHYFKGSDVTPIYQKEIPSVEVFDDGTADDPAPEIYRVYNRLLYHFADRTVRPRSTCVRKLVVQDTPNRVNPLFAVPPDKTLRDTTVLLVDKRFRVLLHRIEQYVKEFVLSSGWTVRRVPIMGASRRTLDGGIVTDIRSLVFRQSGDHILVKGTYFSPLLLDADHHALLAYSLRTRPTTPFAGQLGLRAVGVFRTQVRAFSEWREMKYI